MPIGFHTANLNFEIIREIGQAGKNSQVFIARDIQLDGEIVIKKIAKTALTYDGEYYKEAKILYNHEHPNIVKVHYGCEDADYAYIAMPIYEKGSLKDLVISRHLTVREIIRYSLQFLSGLNHIHSKRLMHLDIKLDNIFITNSNEAALADFGLAKAMDVYNRTEPEFIYSKIIPPEVFNNEEKSFQFDIYQAGIAIYCLANGLDDFDSHFSSFANDDAFAEAVTNGAFPNRNNYLWHMPPSFIKVINKSINPDQNERYQNSLQLMNDLGKISDWLDWEYEVNKSIKKWTLNHHDKSIHIEMSINGNKYDINTVKYINKSKNTSKITKFCKKDLDLKDAKKLVQKAIKELS